MDEVRELFDLSLIDQLAGRDDLVTRDPLLDEIEAALGSPGCRIVLVHGHPGSGKTTLMAGLAQRHPDWPRYFIRRAGEGDGIRNHDGGLASFLTVIGHQLVAKRPELFPDPSQDMDLDVDVTAGYVAPGATVGALHIGRVLLHPFRRFAAKVRLSVDVLEGHAIGLSIREIGDASLVDPVALEIPALIEPLEVIRRDRPNDQIVVIVDGLDELRVRDAPVNVLGWLNAHARLHPSLRFILSSRDDNERLDTLHEIHGDSLRVVNASKDAVTAVGEYAANVSAKNHVVRILAAHRRRPEWFAHRAAVKAAGIFQYVTFLDRALAAVNAEGDDAPRLEWLGSEEEADWPNGIGGLYAKFMLRIKDQVQALSATYDLWDQLYRPMLGLLLVANAPLTVSQLSIFAGIDGPRAAGMAESCRDALLRLDQFLDGGPATGYRFFHSSVADYVASSDARASLRCDEDTSNRQITRYAFDHHGQDGNWKTADPYLRKFLAAHAAAVRLLDGLLEDPRFLAAADPAELLATLGNATRATTIAALYRRTAPDFRAGDELTAIAHLELYAAEAGEYEFAGMVRAMPGDRPWTTAWTHRGRGSSRGTIGRHGEGITAIAVARNHNGQALALTGGNDGQVQVWDLRKGETARAALVPADGTASAIVALAVGELRTGEAFVTTGAWDGTVRAWNIATGRQICAPLAGPENAGPALAVGSMDHASGTSSLTAVCGGNGSVRAWNVTAGTPLGPPIPVADVTAAAIGQAGGRVLVVVATARGGNRELTVCDATTGRPVGQTLRTEDDSFEALAVGEMDGIPVVAVSDTSLGVQVFDAATGEARTKRRVHWGQTPDALALGVIGGRPVLACGGASERSGTIMLLDLTTWAPAGNVLTAHQDGRVTALAISSGVLLSAGLDRVDKETRSALGESIRTTTSKPVVHQWTYADRAGLQFAGTVARPEREVNSIAAAMTSGASVVACCDGWKVSLLDGTTGMVTGPAIFGPSERIRTISAAILADGTAVAIASAGSTVRVWNIERGTQLYPPLSLAIEGEDVSAGLAVTRSGDRLTAVCGTWRSGALVWDLTTGEPVGARIIESLGYVHAMTVGLIDGRAVAVFGGSSEISAHDMETGDLVFRSSAGKVSQPSALELVEADGKTMIVAGAVNPGIITVSDVVGETGRITLAPRAITTVSDELATLALAQVDGQPTAICGGREGNVQVVDLPIDDGNRTSEKPVLGVAVASVAGQPVVIQSCADEINILDLANGRRAAPSPSSFTPSDRGKVATADIGGRAVGVCTARNKIHAWYLDSGESTAMPPASCGELVESIATGVLNGRAVILSGCCIRDIHIFDLETGESACQGISCGLGPASALGLVSYSGDSLLVYNHSGQARCCFVGLEYPPVDIEELLTRRSDVSEQEDTPPSPPRVGKRVPLNRYRNVSGHAMVLGRLEGSPVVLSGHYDGQIDVFAIGTALPVGPPLLAHESEVSALAFAEIDGRPIAASGARNGTVRIWDLADASAVTTVHTTSHVRDLALRPPGYCVIGTERGILAIQFRLPARTSQPSSRIPRDIRGAQICPHHDGHVAEVLFNGMQVTRLCIKGVQTGNPRTDLLNYAQGHCFVVQDLLIITRGTMPEQQSDDIVIPLDRTYFESTDVPHAYEYDGGHFRISIEAAGPYRSLCCYRRSERDLLLRLMKGRR